MALRSGREHRSNCAAEVSSKGNLLDSNIARWFLVPGCPFLIAIP